MAIEETDYFKYDYNRHEYYITIDGVLNDLPYQDAELNARINNLAGWLKRFSRAVYRIIYKNNIQSQRQHIQFMIYENLDNERQALYDAMLEYVMGALESGMDLNAYQQETKKEAPETVMDELRIGNLLNHGEIELYPDDYEDDY